MKPMAAGSDATNPSSPPTFHPPLIGRQRTPSIAPRASILYLVGGCGGTTGCSWWCARALSARFSGSSLGPGHKPSPCRTQIQKSGLQPAACPDKLYSDSAGTGGDRAPHHHAGGRRRRRPRTPPPNTHTFGPAARDLCVRRLLFAAKAARGAGRYRRPPLVT